MAKYLVFVAQQTIVDMQFYTKAQVHILLLHSYINQLGHQRVHLDQKLDLSEQTPMTTVFGPDLMRFLSEEVNTPESSHSLSSRAHPSLIPHLCHDFIGQFCAKRV